MLLSLFSYSQTENQGTITIQDETGITGLKEKWIEVKKRKEGKTKGYRVKIHFGADREQANKIKQDYTLKYPGTKAYEKYQQPNFTIVAGDFRTRLEAYRFLKEISTDFPHAFIVQDEIELPKL